ncbi:hypothetical protein ABZ719_36745 [Streptomyces sp. NPDC006743]|uniref:hypothetical protein n=1 Tax=Streptomyces sp. NPDC006743 TaxID=3154480 RepID=UPI0034513F22
MIQARRDLGFSAETCGVRPLRRAQQLDGHRAVEKLIGGTPLLAHRATAQQFLKLVAVRQQHADTHPASPRHPTLGQPENAR